ncbi:MAG: hypothetical protein BWY15_02042 [Firmicutes bacterium ADurb.Bin193]|nr:MAG: hypothetical protein BWY15_02042 [Firmicutes bacterium ADurb.Bin193]
MTYEKEKTALSVGAEKQSAATQSAAEVLNSTKRISQPYRESKKKFDTIDGKTLMEQELSPIKYIVSDFLSQGLHILAGSPKTGKSWLVLWFCLQIAKGENVWNFKTTSGTTLYLCLEDSLNRIQNRLFDITDDAPDNLHFAVMADTIENGLLDQIENFMKEHPDTNLIVIDTLQKIRGACRDNNQYANDYKDLSILKSIADKYAIAILLVHHLRKSGDDDPMNMISGTNGIVGAVDSGFVLMRDVKQNLKGTLYCTGRDIESMELQIEFDSDTHIWNLVSNSSAEKTADHVIQTVSDFLSSRKQFTGSATELTDEIGTVTGEKILPQVLSKKLSRYANQLSELKIIFSHSRTRDKRILSLKYCDDSDGNDGKNDTAPLSDLPSQLSQPSRSPLP